MEAHVMGLGGRGVAVEQLQQSTALGQVALNLVGAVGIHMLETKQLCSVSCIGNPEQVHKH